MRWLLAIVTLVVVAVSDTAPGAEGRARSRDSVTKSLGLGPEKGSMPIWSMPEATARQNLGQSARTMNRAVMLVGHPEGGSGTGFVISRKHRLLATNAHVADVFHEAGAMFAIQNETAAVYRVDKVWYHPGVVRKVGGARMTLARTTRPGAGPVYPGCPDVAVLRLKEGGPELPAEFTLATPEEVATLFAQPVAMLGYPSHDTDRWPALGDTPQATYHDGVISRMTDFDYNPSVPPKHRQFLQHTLAGWFGFSGSPVFLANGHVVAVHNSLRTRERQGLTARLSHAVRVDCLWELLVHHGLDDKVPVPVEKSSLDLARYAKPDPRLERLVAALFTAGEALLLAADGKHEQAVKKCDEAEDLAPGLPFVHATGAGVLLHYAVENAKQLPYDQHIRVLNAALESAKQYVALAPSDPMAFILVAEIQMRIASRLRERSVPEARDRVQLAMDIVDSLLEHEGLAATMQARALKIRGDARLDWLADRSGALADYNKAIELHPENGDLYYARARYWDAVGQTEMAKAERRRAAEIERTRMEAQRKRFEELKKMRPK